MVRSMVMAFCTVFAMAVTASSQTNRPFLEGRFVASIDSRGHVNTALDGVTETDLSATVPGGGFGIGTFVTPNVSARVNITWFGSTNGTQTLSSPTTSLHSDVELMSQSFEVLGGYHPASAGRVRAGYLLGLLFVRETQKLTTTTTTIGLPPFVPPSVMTEVGEGVSYGTTAVVGFELAVSVGAHVTLVPEVRAHAFDGLLSIRPGVAVRWQP